MTGIHKRKMIWFLGLCAFAAMLFLWQQENTFNGTLIALRTGESINEENVLWHYDNSGSGLNPLGNMDLSRYLPWLEGNRLPRLKHPSSLSISGNYPVLDGATTAYPLYAAAADTVYTVKEKTELKLYLNCSKTEEAYDKLIRGETDMIFVLQPSDEQLQAAKDAGIELRFTPIAKDAFVFFVNSRNPVSDLSLEQIRDVYRKKITNWQELGGDNRKILPFQRPVNSGSQTAMIKEVMKGEKLPQALHEKALTAYTMVAIYLNVARYRDYDEAIGYSFRFFTEKMMLDVLWQIDNFRQRVKRNSPDYGEDAKEDIKRWEDTMRWLDRIEPVKLLAVDGIEPTMENIRSGMYPLTVDLFAVTAGTSNPHTDELLVWLLSPQGQELIERVGYVGNYSTPNTK